jgi:hypothetical protein
MAQISKLIPDWNCHPASGSVTPAMRKKRGAAFGEYFSTTVQGCSLSHYVTSYLFDDIHKYQCLRPDKNLD